MSQSEYPLTSRIRCSECGSFYHWKVRSGVIKWVCSKHAADTTACNSSYYSEERIYDGAIISYNRAFFLRDLFCSREVLLPVFATTLLTPDIVKTAHIPIQHNCTLLEGGARFFATDPVRLQAEIANVDLCCSLSTGVETPEGNWIEIGISIQLQAKN